MILEVAGQAEKAMEGIEGDVGDVADVGGPANVEVVGGGDVISSIGVKVKTGTGDQARLPQRRDHNGQ